MAVYPQTILNSSDEMLRTLGLDGEEVITSKDGSKSLRDALLRDFGITQATPRFLKAIAGRASAAPLLNDLLKPDRKHDLDTYLWGMDVIDFHHRTSFRKIDGAGVHCASAEIAAAAVFHRL
jgi:sulfite reductase alpha subunit-like flavoprotein